MTMSPYMYIRFVGEEFRNFWSIGEEMLEKWLGIAGQNCQVYEFTVVTAKWSHIRLQCVHVWIWKYLRRNNSAQMYLRKKNDLESDNKMPMLRASRVSLNTVELGYVGSLRLAKFLRYIRNPIYTRKFLLFCTIIRPKISSNYPIYTIIRYNRVLYIRNLLYQSQKIFRFVWDSPGRREERDGGEGWWEGAGYGEVN